MPRRVPLFSQRVAFLKSSSGQQRLSAMFVQVVGQNGQIVQVPVAALNQMQNMVAQTPGGGVLGAQQHVVYQQAGPNQAGGFVQMPAQLPTGPGMVSTQQLAAPMTLQQQGVGMAAKYHKRQPITNWAKRWTSNCNYRFQRAPSWVRRQRARWWRMAEQYAHCFQLWVFVRLHRLRISVELKAVCCM